jgi:hypothetical protein
MSLASIFASVCDYERERESEAQCEKETRGLKIEKQNNRDPILASFSFNSHKSEASML